MAAVRATALTFGAVTAVSAAPIVSAAGASAPRRRPVRLACRWVRDPATGRLVCTWEPDPECRGPVPRLKLVRT